MARSSENIPLPEPVYSGNTSLEQLLQQRRSVRNYRAVPLQLSEISQLLWSAQGITHPQGFRTAPSAGALYPLELYVVAGDVDGLEAGIYHYQAKSHRLTRTGSGDLRSRLAQCTLEQSWIGDAAAVVVFAAAYERTTRKYDERGERYVHMEVGHAAQNLFLQAEALGLDTVVVGAFRDHALAELLQLPDDVQPLMLMPVGGRR
jgi:SagB-type dehydrogenase family enzyme